MHCRLLTQYAIVMVEFLAGLRKIKLRAESHETYDAGRMNLTLGFINPSLPQVMPYTNC